MSGVTLMVALFLPLALKAIVSSSSGFDTCGPREVPVYDPLARASHATSAANFSSWLQGGPMGLPISAMQRRSSSAEMRNLAVPCTNSSRSRIRVTGILQCSLAWASTSRKSMPSAVCSSGCEFRIFPRFGSMRPNLGKILNSHPLLHTAEGMLFRDVLAHASEHCKIPVTRIRERELFVQGTARLRISADELRRCIAEMGKPMGAPWSQDEKFAALVAWLALASGS